jgi:hypothetical protein
MHCFLFPHVGYLRHAGYAQTKRAILMPYLVLILMRHDQPKSRYRLTMNRKNDLS